MFEHSSTNAGSRGRPTLEASLKAESYERRKGWDAESVEVFTDVENPENLSQTLKDKGFAVSEVGTGAGSRNTVEVKMQWPQAPIVSVDALEDWMMRKRHR